MFVDYGIPTKAIWSEPICLHNVFRIKADASYLVPHPPLEQGEHVLVLVTAGNGHLEYCDRARFLAQGEVFLFSPKNKPFRYHTIGERWDFWWFEFSGQPPLLPETLTLGPQDDPFRLCHGCLDAVKNGEAQAASALLAALLTELCLLAEQHEPTSEQTELLTQALSHIRRHLADITVGQLATKLRISERTLHQLFVSHIGLSPKQYILHAKLDTACFLLKSTNKSMGEIADHLGFSSPFHFSRIFRERFGTPPSQWRKEHIY